MQKPATRDLVSRSPGRNNAEFKAKKSRNGPGAAKSLNGLPSGGNGCGGFLHDSQHGILQSFRQGKLQSGKARRVGIEFSTDRSDQAIGARLMLVCEWRKIIPSKFAEQLGVSQGTVSAWLNGKKHLGLPSAIIICDKYNITLDWLYRGDPGGLRVDVEGDLRDLRPDA